MNSFWETALMVAYLVFILAASYSFIRDVRRTRLTIRALLEHEERITKLEKRESEGE